MKKLIALLLIPAACLAEDLFLKGAELQVEVTSNCKDGCIVFNRAEVAQMQAAISAMQEAAYKQGLQDGYTEGKNSCKRLSI